MVKNAARAAAKARVEAIANAARTTTLKGPPPVHLWNPPFCGDLDMRIAADGTWFYLKRRSGVLPWLNCSRPCSNGKGTSTFSSPPSRNAESWSKMRPFSRSSSESDREEGGQVLHFRTNVDDWVACGRDHALRFEQQADAGGVKPYLHVRRNLWARVTRALFFDLVELGEERDFAR